VLVGCLRSWCHVRYLSNGVCSLTVKLPVFTITQPHYTIHNMRRTIHITPLHLDVTELPLRTVTPNTNVHALNTKLCLFDMSRPHTNKEAIHILKALSTHTRNLSGHTLELDTILNIVTYLSHIGGNDLKVATVKFLLTTLNKNICLAHKEMKMSLLGSRKHLNDFISYLSCEDTCLVRQTLFLVLSLSTSERKKTSGNISPHALLLECRILDVLYNLLQHEKQDIVDTTLAILANLLKHNTPKDKCGVMEMILHVSRFLTGRSTMHREFVSLVVIANTLTDKCYRQVLSQNGIFECMEQYLTSHNDGLTLNALRVLKQLAVDECALRGFAYGGLLFHIVHTCIAKSRNIQIQIEALKVLQNLTCHSKGRSALFHVEGLSVLMKLFTQSLGHPDEYVCALLNAIYNLSYEPKFQHYFIQNDIVNVFAQFLERPTSFKIGLSILRVLSRFASSHVTYEFTYALLQHNLVPKLHFIYEDYAEGCKTSRSYAHDILCHLSGQKQFIVCYDSDIPWLRYQASVALGYLFTPDQADFLINKKKVVGTLLDYMVYCPTNKLLSSILAYVFYKNTTYVKQLD